MGFNSVGCHAGSGWCWGQDITFMDISSPWANPFVFSFQRISQWKLGLEDSENVRSDCRWCCCVNISHKCKRRWGCVSFLFSYSPFPAIYHCPLPPFFPPVFISTLVVPVHSIRLEYGCVVVDTCYVCSVLSCYDLLLLSMPTDKERWLEEWRQKKKGVTQVP